MSARVFPTNDFIEHLRSYLKDLTLKRSHVSLHAEKLDLMLEIAYGCVDFARRIGYEIPPDFRVDDLDSKWSESWKRLFNEELPSLNELLTRSQLTLHVARDFLKALS